MSLSKPDNDPMVVGSLRIGGAAATGGQSQTRPPAAPPADLPTHAELESIRSVDDMAVKITRIQRLNKTYLTAIAKAEDVRSEVVKISLHDGVARCELKEGAEVRTKAKMLASFKPTGSLVPLAESFGFDINYSLASGDDVLHLSSKHLDVSAAVLVNCDGDDDLDGLAQVRVLGQNLLVLHGNLASLCDELKYTTADERRAKEAALAELNAKILSIHETHGLCFEVAQPADPLNLKISSSQLAALKGWLPALAVGKEAAVLYRMSEHGAAPLEFHRRCDGQGPTFVIYETSEGSIFGGFTSTPWASSGCYTICSDAFIFSLVNPHRSTPPTRYRIKENFHSSAIYLHQIYHPTFGAGHDICAINLQTSAPGAGKGGMCTNPGSTYDCPKDALSGQRGTWWYTDITVVSWPSE